MSILRCPVCSTDLSRTERSYACSNNHSFDIARQGYVNLLLSSQRASRSPGDSAEMIADRRAFLEAGFYDPLRARIIACLNELQTALERPQRILDLGCGEGYYTAAFADPARAVYALDISKPALAIAARRNTAITWCVGTSKALPFHDASLDVVLNIFCRPHARETQRVLQPNGRLLLVGPGPGHLNALREVLYEQVNDDESHTLAQLQAEGFTLTHSEPLSITLELSGAAIGHLARMTPHYWRAPAAGRAKLDELLMLPVQAEFVLHELSIA
ncbi:MAG: rRNA ((745)-N(1))-methyltransferase [Verrucomicrobiaceae bacterium]|nr:rRNA ((745)-N(1))-methyltransferase [Verrucomicrobiaceae bacterium]